MKKFTDITNKDYNLDFNKQKSKELSKDVKSLNDQVEKEIEKSKLEGEWEIVSIIDVSEKCPKLDEAIIINAELGSGHIKRGDEIYITAQIKRPGQTMAYHHMQMGVVKVRVIDIYHTMAILNNLR
jgi:hypothetical protein